MLLAELSVTWQVEGVVDAVHIVGGLRGSNLWARWRHELAARPRVVQEVDAANRRVGRRGGCDRSGKRTVLVVRLVREVSVRGDGTGGDRRVRLYGYGGPHTGTRGRMLIWTNRALGLQARFQVDAIRTRTLK